MTEAVLVLRTEAEKRANHKISRSEVVKNGMAVHLYNASLLMNGKTKCMKLHQRHSLTIHFMRKLMGMLTQQSRG
jgi:hypothetical protein